jgi:hypothetical protein
MKKTILIFSVLIVGTIGSIIFIRNSNDHKECSTSVVHSKDADGNDITTENHICNEKYNF